MDGKLDVLNQEERRHFNRKLMLLSHILLGIFTAMIYLSELDLGNFPYWQRRAGLMSLLVAAPPLLPYVISAVHSWRTATYDRLRVALFMLVLVLGSFGTGCAIVGAFGLRLDHTTLLWAFAIQALVYFFTAEFLFDVDSRE
jgi:hypothetical protein